MIPTRRFTFRAMALLGLGLLPGCPDNTTTTYASLPVGRRDPRVFGTESANNMIVRLRPGD